MPFDAAQLAHFGVEGATPSPPLERGPFDDLRLSLQLELNPVAVRHDPSTMTRRRILGPAETR
jgi:hypothetical protein